MSQSLWGPKKPNYERQAMQSSYQKEESDKNSTEHAGMKNKFNPLKNMTQEQQKRADQLSNTTSPHTSELEQSRSMELQRQLVERQRKQTEQQAEDLEKTSKKLQELQEDITEHKAVSDIDYKIKSEKVQRTENGLGEIDQRIKRIGRSRM